MLLHIYLSRKNNTINTAKVFFHKTYVLCNMQKTRFNEKHLSILPYSAPRKIIINTMMTVNSIFELIFETEKLSP